MIERISRFLEDRFQIPQGQVIQAVRRMLIGMAALASVLIATLIVALDSILPGVTNIASLQVDDVAPRDIVAPANAVPYISELLTEARRQDERDSLPAVYDPPDPEIARQQTELTQQILEYMDNIRADRYGTQAQRIADLNQITAIVISQDTAASILEFDQELWSAVEDEILTIVPRIMRQEIRPGQQLQNIRAQLENQVNATRFNFRERRAIVDIVDDLVLANTFENINATETARQEAADSVEPVTRSFVSGEIIVRGGERISPLVYEALISLNLLQRDDVRLQQTLRTLIATTVTMVIMGLYMARYAANLIYHDLRKLSLVAALFLLMLAMVRFLGVDGNLFLFPTAALGLVYVTIAGSHVAIIGGLALAFLTGLMMNDSLQVTAVIAASSISGTLVLKRGERLNSFFVAGGVVGLVEAALVAVFNLGISSAVVLSVDFASQVGESLLSGLLLVPATAIAAMYAVTLLFNLPTPLKLIDLSQPSKPLLQRLLREAPGTYQHSLQVANLAEQAANAIGADAQLTHVAALYHDIGKMLNPLFFTENQQDVSNPHDALNDPYRSADMIISHVTEGDELAQQSRLPQRIRDFIREHHGTTEVYVFYQRALQQVDGDATAVDIADFTYPGPRPRSKETAILMMADSCEAAVRSVKPQTRQEIHDMVVKIIDAKRASGQLDDSGLTLNELRIVRDIFVDLLQGMFHPRINYSEAIARKPESAVKPVITRTAVPLANGVTRSASPAVSRTITTEAMVAPTRSTRKIEETLEIVDEEPLPEVPRLPSLDLRRNTSLFQGINPENGSVNPPQEKKPEEKQDV